MRLLSLVLLSGLLVACRRPVEMRGLYVNNEGSGAFFPCDQSKILLWVSDSALAASYRRTATTPRQLLFVRLQGVRTDSGSIYGGAHYLVVHRILEIRARRDGECPSGVTPVLPVLPPRSSKARTGGGSASVSERAPPSDATIRVDALSQGGGG